VNHNHLTGTIPTEVGASSIKVLSLNDNALTGSIPAEVHGLPCFACMLGW
jgi:hypothetical protein